MVEHTVSILQVDKIVVLERLRPIDEGWVEAIAESIEQIGQKTPVEVVPRLDHYQLVAGAHRFAAVKRLGRKEILVVISDLDELQARLSEIDENLVRRELSHLDRAVFLAERKRVYETLHPEAKRGGDRSNPNNLGLILGFAQQTAGKMGLSEETIRRCIKIGALDPDVRARITGTWLVDKEGELYALAKHDPTRQMQLVEILLDEQSHAKSVTAAIRLIDGHATEALPLHEVQLNKLMNTWRRAGARAQHGFIAFLRDSRALEDIRNG